MNAKNSDKHRVPKYKPHKQLKTIRARLGITQVQAASLLGKSYPYFLSVETGQRELSKPLAAKIAQTFGVARIEDRDAEPLIAGGRNKLLPFTKALYEDRLSREPSFYIEEDGIVVTPTLTDYARCTRALLLAAKRRKTLQPVVAGFLEWSRRSLSSDAMLDSFRECFNELFPGEIKNSDAFLAVTTDWGRHVKNEIWEEQKRRTAFNMRQRKRKRKS